MHPLASEIFSGIKDRVVLYVALFLHDIDDAFVERGDTLNVVSVLRLLSGAVASVWGRGSSRLIVTPTLTAWRVGFSLETWSA